MVLKGWYEESDGGESTSLGLIASLSRITVTVRTCHWIWPLTSALVYGFFCFSSQATSVKINLTLSRVVAIFFAYTQGHAYIFNILLFLFPPFRILALDVSCEVVLMFSWEAGYWTFNLPVSGLTLAPLGCWDCLLFVATAIYCHPRKKIIGLTITVYRNSLTK